MIDIDAFQERAAIMEFDGGMTRFRAETLAAQAQGKRRDEVLNEIRIRNSSGQQNHRSAAERQSTNDMPAVQRSSEKQERPMSERHVQI